MRKQTVAHCLSTPLSVVSNTKGYCALRELPAANKRVKRNIFMETILIIPYLLFSKAFVTSLIISNIFSNPTEIRIMPGSIPILN